MLPAIPLGTYRRYKQDTDDIATWLATTAIRFGFSADRLSRVTQNNVLKSQRLKGKARKLAKNAAKSNSVNSPKILSKPLSKYTIAVKDFVTLAEYLGSRTDLKIPELLWASVERAIRLRKTYGDYHALRQAKSTTGNSSVERHAHFLRILEKVKDILQPRRQAPPSQTKGEPVAIVDHDRENRGYLDNMFAALKVEEPSEEFLNTPVTMSSAAEVGSADALYNVEPFDDPLELYLGIAALLQDYSKIRSTVRDIWNLYSQGQTGLVSASATTNLAIQTAQQLEEQFLKDHPLESDTVRARNLFFGAQCELQGQDLKTRARASDPINLTLYDLVEVSLLNSHILIESFGDVLRDSPLPLYKPGFFGIYDSTRNRGAMSGPDKFDEDKIILLEILSDIVFFDYINRKTGLPATDEFSKAVGLFREQGRHTLALDFAAQIHVDIQHALRRKPNMAWIDLRNYAINSKVSLDRNFKFHEKVKIDNWPPNNDLGLKSILDKIDRWVIVDTFQKSKTEMMIQSGLRPDPPTTPYSFFIRHPWLCGSILFGIKLDMQKAGISFLNAWGSAKSTAQIYNAVRKEKFLDKQWQDMELALLLYDDPAMFIGSRPNNVDEYFRRFCLSMGYSAQNFAVGGKRQQRGVVASSEGPRGIIEEETMTPIANELRFEYGSFEGSSKSAPNIEKVMEKCLRTQDEPEDAGADEDASTKTSGKRAQKRRVYTVPEMLTQICQSLMSEDLALTFDHFHLHRSSWLVLRGLKEALDDDLKRIYSTSYLDTENQLPFLAGYIFMTAVATKSDGRLLLPKKEDVVSSKLLMQAAVTLESMMETGMGAQEVNILRDKYGMEFEIQV